MLCPKCGYLTSNKLKKYCIRKGCGGRMIKNTTRRGFSVMDAYRTERGHR